MSTLRLGTRGSPLALFQARAVSDALAAHGGTPCELVVIRTSGDQLADRPLSDEGGKRLFVKEIEEALASGDVDLAVHSSKDLPADLPAGLSVGAVLPREDPTDAVVLEAGAAATVRSFEAVLEHLAGTARIGTGSVRRIAQLRPVLPNARFDLIRGNVDTRLRKLDRGDYDGIVLASAGLRRLDRVDRLTAAIPTDICVPAPGQGIIAIEMRADDGRTAAALARINDPDALAALVAERALVTALGGGCQMPIGGYCRRIDGELDLLAIVASLDGSRLVRHEARRAGDPPGLGREVADELLRQGAGAILAEAKASGTSTADPHGP